MNKSENKILNFNSEKYKESFYSSDDKRVEKIINLMGKDKAVLDLGCLDGGLGELFIKNKNKVYGIDASETAIVKAKQRGIEAVSGSLENPLHYYSDKMFDVVFAGEVIEHIFNIDQLFSEVHRILKDNGSFIATTPNLASLGRRLLLLFNRNPHIEISYDNNAAGHIRYFIKDTLFQLFAKHNFQISYFGSDVVNFDGGGKLKSFTLANIFPTIGQTLIVKAEKA